MRTKTLLIGSCALIGLSLSACKKDKTDKIPDINATTVTVQQVNVPLNMYSIDNTAQVWMVPVGQRIYFSNGSQSGGTPFFSVYDMPTNNIENLEPNSALCNCNNTMRLETDGTNIYNFANTSLRYTPLTQTWSNPAYPYALAATMGEPGTAVAGSKLYVLGGRTSLKTLNIYNAAKNTWTTGKEYPTAVKSPYMVSDGQGTVYAMGTRITYGTTDTTVYAGARKKMYRYDIAGNTWTAMPDMPFDGCESNVQRTAIMYNGRIFVLNNGALYVFDTAKQVWRTIPYYMPQAEDVNMLWPNLMVMNNHLYLAGMQPAKRLLLYELVVKDVIPADK